MTARPYVDSKGRRHTEAVEHWHTAVIKSLGIRKCTSAEIEATKQSETGGQNGQA